MQTQSSQLQQTLENRWKAMIECDREGLSALLHEQYIYIAESGKVYDKQAFLKAFSNGDDRDSFAGKMTIDSMEIEGSTATIACKIAGVFNSLRGGPLKAFKKVHTLVKVRDAWLFLAGHSWAITKALLPKKSRSL
jgi:hypothetical protein